MKFLMAALGAMMIVSVLWIALIAFQLGRPTLSSQWLADAYAMKLQKAEQIHEPKIVIVGGSSALFGIDSKKLEQTYDMPVVNLGVNAGLLLPYILLKSQTVLKKGDIVLMPLEYQLYTYDGTPNVQMIDQIYSRDPSYFWKLSFAEQVQIIWLTTFPRLLDGIFAQGGEKTMCGPYGYQNLDERGDQTHTSKAESKQWEYDWDTLQKELPRRYGYEEHDDSLAWKWLRKYAVWAKRNGITVIVIPPTMMYHQSYKNDPIERRFYETLITKIEDLGFKFMGNPYESMYNRELYFNTDYHLTDEGRNIWTHHIIDTLKDQIVSDK